MEDSYVEESDRASDNVVEFEGSVSSSSGPPSLPSSSAEDDDDDELTYRKQLIEEEEKVEQMKEQIVEDKKSQKRLKRFCDSEILKRLEAIEEALKSRVPDSSGGCSSRDFSKFAEKLDRRFRQSGPAKKITLPHKMKQEEVAETESDNRSIATDSTRTPVRKIVRAQWTVFPATSTLMQKSRYGWKPRPNQ
jgi:hypothetical protein